MKDARIQHYITCFEHMFAIAVACRYPPMQAYSHPTLNEPEKAFIFNALIYWRISR